MSCNYADGLSPYENKGVLGVPERFDTAPSIQEKCEKLAEWIKISRHVVLHTGAGVSTAAGIPDFRGPHGVWTLEKQGKKPNFDISFEDAKPTKTHIAIKKLIDENYVHFVISQNIDGLHLRSGIERKFIAELHGNMFVEQCNVCNNQFIRSSPTSTVGKKCLKIHCKRILRGRPCRGKLFDTVLDWEHSLPAEDLEMSDYHSSVADLNICLGTTLQIVPSGNLPLRCKKYGGRVVIVNLQPTKHDKKADLIINAYCDTVLENVTNILGLEIGSYNEERDPTKANLRDIMAPTWNISKNYIKEMKTLYEKQCHHLKRRKLLTTSLKDSRAKEKADVVEVIDLT